MPFEKLTAHPLIGARIVDVRLDPIRANDPDDPSMSVWSITVETVDGRRLEGTGWEWADSGGITFA